jgi:hypothetical protein
VNAINARGDVAGSFLDATQAYRFRGFLRDINGDLTVVDPPNSSFTVATGINNRGEVAGSFIDSSEGGKNRGFLFWGEERGRTSGDL